MQTIPVVDVPSQLFSVNLAGQQCQIKLYMLSTGFYCDLYVNSNLIIGGVLCVTGVRIVINKYLGFVGDLIFYDTQGTNNPTSPGLGSRYLFCYVSVSDLGSLG